jgi:hypothetical protein
MELLIIITKLKCRLLQVFMLEILFMEDKEDMILIFLLPLMISNQLDLILN